MDFSTFVQIVKRSWWIFVIVLVSVLGCTAYFTSIQTPLYSATTSFVVWPGKNLTDSDEFLRSLNTLERRSFIATYAKILSSNTIQEQAFSKSGLPSSDYLSYSFKSSVLPDTNIIRITVLGPDPVHARDLANAIFEEGDEYVSDNYGLFRLKLLDRATVATHSEGPSIKRNLGIAFVIGSLLALGSMIVFDFLLYKRSNSVIKTESVSKAQQGTS